MISYIRKKYFPLPPLGLRILKTGIAVFLCFLIYVLRNYDGMVSQSVIAAIICVQPYKKDSKKGGINRLIGTIMGGFWGLFFLLVMKLFPLLSLHMVLVYFLMSLGVILVLYSSVVLKTTDTAALAAIVFLCIIISYPEIETPVRLTIDRIFDTLIGVCVAVFVNTFHMPVHKHPEKIFFLRLHDIAEDRFAKLEHRELIKLNRLYEDGIHICLESRWAPAFLISQIGILNVNMPVIVMNGAALYSISENQYYEVMGIPRQDADFLCEYLLDRQFPVVIFAIRNNSLLIFRKGELSPIEQDDYNTMRRSPYRNFMNGSYTAEDQIACIRFIVENEEVDAVEQMLRTNPKIMEKFMISKRTQPRKEAYTGFYFYRKDVSIEKMEQILLEYARTHHQQAAVPVHIRPTRPDYSPSRDVGLLLDEVKNEFEQPILPDLYNLFRKRP